MTNSVVSWETWNALCERDNYMCTSCTTEEDLQPAHYTPRSAQGGDSLDNLMLLCNNCHRGLHTGWLNVIRIDGNFFFRRVY